MHYNHNFPTIPFTSVKVLRHFTLKILKILYDIIQVALAYMLSVIVLEKYDNINIKLFIPNKNLFKRHIFRFWHIVTIISFQCISTINTVAVQHSSLNCWLFSWAFFNMYLGVLSFIHPKKIITPRPKCVLFLIEWRSLLCAFQHQGQRTKYNNRLNCKRGPCSQV